MKITISFTEKEISKISSVINEAFDVEDTCDETFGHKIEVKHEKFEYCGDGNGSFEISISEKVTCFFMNKYGSFISLVKNAFGLFKSFFKDLMNDIEDLIGDDEPEVKIDDMAMQEYLSKKFHDNTCSDNDDTTGQFLINRIHAELSNITELPKPEFDGNNFSISIKESEKLRACLIIEEVLDSRVFIKGEDFQINTDNLEVALNLIKK